MSFETLIETCIKFSLLLASAVRFGVYKGSKMVYSVLSCTFISGCGEETVLCET